MTSALHQRPPYLYPCMSSLHWTSCGGSCAKDVRQDGVSMEGCVAGRMKPSLKETRWQFTDGVRNSDGLICA